MDKYIYDENNGLWYELQGEYYLPCLTLPTKKEKPMRIWGQRHKRYLKEHRKAAYTTLLTSGKLNIYLANINEQAQERFEKLIDQMEQAQDITEQLNDFCIALVKGEDTQFAVSSPFILLIIL